MLPRKDRRHSQQKRMTGIRRRSPIWRNNPDVVQKLYADNDRMGGGDATKVLFGIRVKRKHRLERPFLRKSQAVIRRRLNNFRSSRSPKEPEVTPLPVPTHSSNRRIRRVLFAFDRPILIPTRDQNSKHLKQLSSCYASQNSRRPSATRSILLINAARRSPNILPNY